MTVEEWRPVLGLPMYRVSSLARVMRVGGTGRGRPRDRILRTRVGTTGYLMVTIVPPGLRQRTVRVHRLLAEAFMRPMLPGEVVNHLDGVKTNNDPANLEITDRQGNLDHAMRHGLIRTGIRHGMAKLTDEQVREIRAAFAAGEQAAPIAARYGISRSYAYHLKHNRERASA